MVDQQSEVFLISPGDGGLPIACISKDNFLGYETDGAGNMTIRYKTLRMPQKDRWEDTAITFSITSGNKHIPPILKRWGVHA